MNTAFILRTFIPKPALLAAAVGAQVLFVLSELAYLLATRSQQAGAPIVEKA